MIKEEKVKRDVFETRTIKNQIEVLQYICSDGKVFSEHTQRHGSLSTAKQNAEEWEERLIQKQKAKEELKFYSIQGVRDNSGDYEREFLFYLSPNISEESRYVLKNFICDYNDWHLKNGDLINKESGWYRVYQEVSWDDSDNGQCCYSSNFYLSRLEDYCNQLQETTDFYFNLRNKLEV